MKARQKRLESINLDGLQNMEQARECLVRLLNLVEELAAENGALRAETQRLRDQINRLKGEQGRPKVKANRRQEKEGAGRDHSSEGERRKPREWKKGEKVSQMKIDREEVLRVEQRGLPADAEFKGYEEVVVQDVKIKTDNVRFLKERWYSASEGKSYLAEMPAGYGGEFGPGLKALVLVLYYAGNMTGPKILELLQAVGISLSKLMVLAHPEIPLHNNPAELGARQRVRKRSVSGGPRTEEGKQAWEPFNTLPETAKKLAVSVYHYIHDRVSEAYQLPSLADLIAERAEQHPLGPSWKPP